MIETALVYVKLLDENAIVPEYAHATDAGMDLYASKRALIPSGGRVSVPTGIAIAIPEGYVGLVHPRSGMAINHGITVLNSPGTIDSGYRGEIKVVLFNSSPSTFFVERYDRIAQLVLQRYQHAVISVKDDLPDGERGDNGFGSTGS